MKTRSSPDWAKILGKDDLRIFTSAISAFVGTCSSREAAKILGISLMTLQRHIAAKKISAPSVQHFGGNQFRLWTARDVERVRKQLLKIKNGRRRKK
jgi:excisionase family DNA binding protein